MTVRGIRNCNPGNIDRTATIWQGMSVDQTGDSRFCVFDEMRYGCRALIKLLITYMRRHGLTTVRGIINRWAPPIENNTSAYVRGVSAQLGVEPDQQLPVTRESYIRLAKAIAAHECGKAEAATISAETWEEAADLAGL